MSTHIPMTAPANAYVNPKKKHFPDKVALIDADRMKHLVAYDVCEDLKRNLQRNPQSLRVYIDKRIGEIFSQFSAKGYIFCFSGKSFDTFRNKVAIEKEYKGNRKADPSFYEGKIEDMAEAVRVVMNTYPTLLFPDLEADDIISFLQCEHTFVFSNDKDLKQIPGLHFCMDRKDLITITQEQAFESLFYKMIVGDSTDFIPGLKGYGPKKAQDIISSVPLKQLPEKILHEYKIVYGITHGIDCFVETWNLVKLRVNRGTYFTEKYKNAFNLLELIINTK